MAISNMFADGTDHIHWEEMLFSSNLTCMSCAQHTQRIASASQTSHTKNILNVSRDY